MLSYLGPSIPPYIFIVFCGNYFIAIRDFYHSVLGESWGLHRSFLFRLLSGQPFRSPLGEDKKEAGGNPVLTFCVWDELACSQLPKHSFIDSFDWPTACRWTVDEAERHALNARLHPVFGVILLEASVSAPPLSASDLYPPMVISIWSV